MARRGLADERASEPPRTRLQRMSIDASKIKFIVLDVDGTLTDGGIYILESGEEFKKFNSKDGFGVQRAVQ